MKIKKIIEFILLSLVLITIIGFIVSVKIYKDTSKNPFKETNESMIVIDAKDGTFSEVLFSNNSVFKNSIFIRMYSKLNEVSISVKKGVYEIPVDTTLEDLIKYLENGTYNTSIKKITIPEGYTIEQIGKTLENSNILSYEDFINGVLEYNLPSYVKENKDKRYNLEGYLFPDTYLLEEGMTANKVISIMLSRFENILGEIEKEKGITINESDVEDMIIKASMIEREVSLKEEKALVASVIENRTKIGMKLQIDATVLYAMGEHKEGITLKDLKYKSLYNTYENVGLPVGPISNPGKDSIAATINPTKTNYIYYLTKDGTNHKFFKEYRDFLNYKNKKI